MNYQLKKLASVVNVTRIANIHYFEFIEEYHTANDRHDFCELVYVDKGALTVVADNYSGSLNGNQLIIHRANENHSLICDNETAPNVIIIGFECDCKELTPFSEHPFSLTPYEKDMLADLMKEGMKVFAPPYDLPNMPEMKERDTVPFGAEQLVRIRLEMFLITIIRGSARIDPELKTSVYDNTGAGEVRHYISEHYHERILLDNICFLFKTNKTTLCHSFKAAYGMTILDYANSLRLEEAKKLLREKKLTVTEISEKLGFNSVHYFSRMFKKSENLTPTAYINTIRSKLDI